MKKEPSWRKLDGKARLEQQAFLLAEIFLKYFKKHGYAIFKLCSVKETRWWSSFLKIIERYGNQKDWNPELFIKVQFQEFGKIYPQQMLSKRAYEVYKGYNERGEAYVDFDVKVARELLNSYKKIRKWEEKNNKKFFEDKKNQFLLQRNIISPYYLSISKPFINYYKNLTEKEQHAIIEPRVLSSSRMFIFSRKKILEKMKEALGKDFH